MPRSDLEVTPGIATSQTQAVADDHLSTHHILANDDSGYSEHLNFTNNSFENENSFLRPTAVHRGRETHRLSYGNDQEKSHFTPADAPVPQLSSTPNRVEIFIEDNWNSAREDAENIPFDLLFDDSDFYDVKPRDQKVDCLDRKRSSVQQPLRDSTNDKYEDIPRNEKPRENALVELFEEESLRNLKYKIQSEVSDSTVTGVSPAHVVKTDPDRLLEVTTDVSENISGSSSRRHFGYVQDDNHLLLCRETVVDDTRHTDDMPKYVDPSIIESSTAQLDNARSVHDSGGGAENGRFACENLISDSSETRTKISKTFDQKSSPDMASAHRRKGRKTRTPRRSPTKCDPRFKGATVWLQTEFKAGKSRLNISAFYSNVTTLFSEGARQRLFGNHVFTCSPDSSSYSDTEENCTPPHVRETYLTAKTCASCRTRRTPLWRDAEDGTPLCNACGIRYKKYRLRCSRCWHIPKKDIKTYPNCPSCGASLKYVFSRRTW